MIGSRRDPARRRDERGAAMVEFALIAPIFIALVFGIISYGWMLSYRQGISQGVSEAARSIAVAPGGGGTITDSVKANGREAVSRSLRSYGVTCVGEELLHHGDTVGTCTFKPERCGSADCVRVTVRHENYDRHPLVPSFPGLGIILPKDVGYSTTAEINS